MADGRTVLIHVLGHLAGIAVYVVVSLAGGIVFIVSMNQAFGQQDGMAVALFVCAIGAFVLLPLWFIIWFFAGFVRWYYIAGAAAAIAAFAALLYCGGFERCFLPGGFERMLGTFTAVITMLGALAHHLVVQWMVKRV
jgi:hypothetical protein